MKTFALAFLAVMPMACLANVGGGFDLGYAYFMANGSGDNCTIPPRTPLTGVAGKSLELFNCDGKNAGDETCYCIASTINGRKLYYGNFCATCRLAAKPNKGFTPIFQFAAYHNLLLNLVEKITLKKKLTDDDLYVFGADNSIKIPIVSPKMMANYTSIIKTFINASPEVTADQKEAMKVIVDAAFKKYSGLEDIMHDRDEHLIENFKKVMPRILGKLGLGNVCASDDFKKQLDEAIKQVKPEILERDEE